MLLDYQCHALSNKDFKMVSIKLVQLSFLCVLYLAHNVYGQNKTNSTTNPSQVPVLDLKQILEIANPSTTTTTTTPQPVSTTSTTTVVPPSSSTSTTTTQSTTKELPTTTASTTISTSEPPITTTVLLSDSEVPTENIVNNSSDTPEIILLSQNESDIAPEPLMERTTTEAATTTISTTPSTTTTTPEPIRLGPIVKISPGELRPLVLRSRRDKRYFAFRGIPYASPPIHFQRFKDPGPTSPWSGVLNATSYGPACIQYNILSEQVEGEEDCLTLNIFTNWLPSGRNKKRGPGLYPVMVFFHQGAFMFGTSKDFEEKYMMDEPVVLVTVQYRLGAFGFLNTQGDSDARGNQGLKDQLLALKFIRQEIHNFNGDNNLVTIFGESAGGSSVHYHLLSDQSKGLFQRAISMSGTALSPWAFTRSPRRMAKKLGTLLNCPTTDMNELFTCLQGHDARVIADKTKDLYVWNTDPLTPFAPSIEVEESVNAFLTESPYSLMKAGHINDATPWMLGVVENVCLLDAWSILVNKQLTEDLNVDWHRIAPITFMYKETALEPDAVSNQIRAYYFQTNEIGNATAQKLEQLYSDRYFNHGIRTSALMHVRTNEATPVYLYMFNFKGAQSHTKFAGISDIIGVSEGDDLRFLFNTNRFEDIPLNSTDGDLSQKFIKLWVSFATEGKPSAVWSNQEWKRISPAQVKGDEALMYYSLNDKCGFIEEPFSSRMNFWDTLPLNENENELISSQSIHNKYPIEDEDIFGRYS